MRDFHFLPCDNVWLVVELLVSCATLCRQLGYPTGIIKIMFIVPLSIWVQLITLDFLSTRGSAVLSWLCLLCLHSTFVFRPHTWLVSDNQSWKALSLLRTCWKIGIGALYSTKITFKNISEKHSWRGCVCNSWAPYAITRIGCRYEKSTKC